MCADENKCKHNKMAAMIVITLWSCVFLLKVIESSAACDVSLSTVSNIVQLGSDVSLTCRVCNVSFNARIDFYHNNSLVAYHVFGISSIINTILHRFSTRVDNNFTALTLTIVKFLETSQGSYTCSIFYTTTNTSNATQFMSFSVPVTSVTLTPLNQVLNAVEGLPISYTKCVSSIGRPLPEVTWYLDNGTQHTYLDDVNITMYTNVFTSNDVTTSTLAFTPTRSVDNQSIYCNVSNGYSVISSTHRIRLNIMTYPSRPIIKYNGKHITDIYIIKGRNVSIECSSIGMPIPVIIWKTPSGELINNTVLTISTAHNGSYNCSAQSILSPSEGAPILAINTSVVSVNILYPPEVINCTIGAESVVTAEKVKVVKYETFEMNCTSDGNPPPTRFTWLMPDGSGSTDSKLLLPSVRSIGNNSYTLRVSNIMNGTFDTELTFGYLTETYTFDILFPPMVPDLYYNGSTEILLNTSIINVIRGRNAHLLCKASSNPDPSYNWFVDGIQTTNATLWNGTIQKNTKVQCFVSNTMNATGKQPVKRSSNSSLIIMAMFSPDTPTFTFNACGRNVQTNYLKVIEGHSVKGMCTTNSYPTSIYSWIPDTFGNASSFFISAANASDTGTYTCTSINVMRTTFDGITEEKNESSFFMDILVPVDVQRIANATVVLNSNFSVTCPYAEGKTSKISLTWAHNGTMRIKDAERTLILKSVKLTDEGYYTCKVSYRLEPTMCAAVDDYDESSFYLDVQYAANIRRFHSVGFDLSNKSITINENQSVTLFCEVDSDPVAYLQVINTTRGSERLLKEIHNNTIYASFVNARCEYDMGVYECKGSNTHNVVQQVRSIEIMIYCAPRPTPFSSLRTTFYRRTNDSVVITLTIVAYPPPSTLNGFIWQKQIYNEWVTLQNSSGFTVHISSDRLQTNLSKSQLLSDDFTNYTVHANNEIGSWEQMFVIQANEKPSAPKRFEVVEDSVTENSVTVEWTPGFDGGEEQRFVVVYRKATDVSWTNKTLSAAIVRILIDGLSAGTSYEVKMCAENAIGKSDDTTLKHVVTKSYSDRRIGSAVATMGASVGGSLGCVVVISIVVFVIRRRRNNAKRTYKRKFKSKKNGQMAYENYLSSSANDESVRHVYTTITNPTYKGNTDTPYPRFTDGLKTTPSLLNLPEPVYGNTVDSKSRIESSQIQDLRRFTWQCKQDPTDIFRDFYRLCEAADSKATHPTDNVYLSVEDNSRPMLTKPAQGNRNGINAVCISTFREQDKLILTPAITEGSTDLNLIWLLHDYKIATLVILHDKIVPYIPDHGNDIVIGPFGGKLLTTANQSHYTEHVVRYKSIAEHDGFYVRVFQFKCWPDHDTLCKTSDMLHLLIAVQDSASDGKVLVQCGDGYTRSGLFAVIWSIAERIKRDGEVAVTETVRLTKRRCRRVITNESQFLFCHNFAKEYVESCMAYVNL